MMRNDTSRLFLGALIAAAIAGLGACELVAAVDRDKIPGSDASAGGSAGNEAGTNEGGDVTSEDALTDKPTDVKDSQPEADALTGDCTDNEKNGNETDVDCGGSCVAEGKKCADTKGCGVAADCQNGVCTNKKCVAAKCDDTVHNGNETDVDCGGSCVADGKLCGTDKGCGTDGDCQSGVCDSGTKKCKAPGCTDNKKNGDETDIDCGGSCTNKCTDDKGCSIDADCLNKNCLSVDGGTPKCAPADCNNTKQDGTETDVDCGGTTCGKCAADKKCTAAGDCLSGVCDTTQDPDKCKAAACDDTVKNGDETDVDCGGTCNKKCANTKECLVGGDCESGFCNTSLTKPVCEAAGCNDTFLNGDETDIDCGGSCKKCADNANCKIANDCISLNCGDAADSGASDAGLTCIPATCGDGVQNQGESDIDCGGTGNTCPRCADGKACTLVGDCQANHACDSQTNKCVECTSDDNCPLGKLCNTSLNTCSIDGCTVNHSCAGALACCTGVCSDLQTDPLHCGQCTTPCSTAHVPTATCASGACNGACEGGYDDCNNDKKTDGCEIELATNASNCGACGTVCSNVHIATPVCSGSQCVGTCDTDWGDCDTNKQTTGCETDLTSTVAHCGTCAISCTVANGTAKCDAKVCAIDTCGADYADCSGGYADGCETNITNDTLHCGGCSTTCSVDHGTAKCTAKVCGVDTCTSPYADCTGGYADGCETDTSNTTSHCGSCGHGCSNLNASALGCTAGACTPTCSSGYDNCSTPPSGQADDGCETNLNMSTANCGACGRACSNTQVDQLTCQAGVCNSTCLTGYGNCSMPVAPTVDNACETTTNTDAANCGACGHACGFSGTCAAGLCNCGTAGACAAGKACASADTCEL